MTAQETTLVAGATGQHGGAVERQSGVSHFDTKWEVEEHLRSLDLSLTIARHAYFFENFGGWALQPQEDGAGYTLAMPLSSYTTLQCVAAVDIGVADGGRGHLRKAAALLSRSAAGDGLFGPRVSAPRPAHQHPSDTLCAAPRLPLSTSA